MAEKHSLDQYSQPHSVADNVQPSQGENQWYSSTDPKRRKVDQQMAKSNIDPHNAPVSRVVHGRAIPDGCTFQMIVNILQRFGKISYITMMPRLRQALVEFEHPEDALNCVRTTAKNQLYILERPVFFNFSTSQEITRSPYGYAPDVNQAPPDEPMQNHILLYTVFNPSLPINVEVLHTISSPYGVVQRIAIFRKNGVQALVEFDSNASAARAKANLEGADIYAGCCTLKTEYARTQHVNVYKNDDMTWDFTVQGSSLAQFPSGGLYVGQLGSGLFPQWPHGYVNPVLGPYQGHGYFPSPPMLGVSPQASPRPVTNAVMSPMMNVVFGPRGVAPILVPTQPTYLAGSGLQTFPQSQQQISVHHHQSHFNQPNQPPDTEGQEQN